MDASSMDVLVTLGFQEDGGLILGVKLSGIYIVFIWSIILLQNLQSFFGDHLFMYHNKDLGMCLITLFLKG